MSCYTNTEEKDDKIDTTTKIEKKTEKENVLPQISAYPMMLQTGQYLCQIILEV